MDIIPENRFSQKLRSLCFWNSVYKYFSSSSV